MARRSQIMMPVEEADAAQLIEIEVLRSISDRQKETATILAGVQDEIRGVREQVQDTRERVIRIESNQLDRTVANLAEKVESNGKRIDALEADKDRRDGAIGLGNWALRSWPALIGFALLVAVILKSTGRL